MEQHKATENVKVDNQGSLNRWNEIVDTRLISIVTVFWTKTVMVRTWYCH